MKLFKWFIAGVCFFYFIQTNSLVFGRDLSNRLGLGFVNQFSNSSSNRPLPALSAKYGLTKDLHFLAALGVSTTDPTALTIGGKVFKNLFYETNLNFYSMAGLAYLSERETGIEVLAGVGAEFFIPGLESLGLSFETGLSLSNITGSFALKTIGFSFLHAGIHFYF